MSRLSSIELIQLEHDCMRAETEEELFRADGTIGAQDTIGPSVSNAQLRALIEAARENEQLHDDLELYLERVLTITGNGYAKGHDTWMDDGINAVLRCAEERDRLRRHAEALRVLVMHYDEEEDGGEREEAPGHSHEVPGVWDKSNGPPDGGKPCEWCAAWKQARAFVKEG